MWSSQTCLQAPKQTTPKKIYYFSCGHGYPSTDSGHYFIWVANLPKEQLLIQNYRTPGFASPKTRTIFFMPAPEELTPHVYTPSLCVSEQCLTTFCEAGWVCSSQIHSWDQDAAVLTCSLEKTSLKFFQNVSNDILMNLEVNQTIGWNIENRKVFLNSWVSE